MTPGVIFSSIVEENKKHIKNRAKKILKKEHLQMESMEDIEELEKLRDKKLAERDERNKNNISQNTLGRYIVLNL